MSDNLTANSPSTSTSLYTKVEGEGTPLVLLHGWGMNHAIWCEVASNLSQSYSVTSIDLPGFGNSSECLPEIYDLPSLSERVLKVIPDNAFILGWSMGGLIAQYLACHHSHRIQGLITLASTPKFVADSEWAGIQPKILAQFQQQLAENFQLTLKRFLAIQTMGSENPKQDMRLIQQKITQVQGANPVALAEGLGLLLNTDLREDIQQLSIPRLSLFGRLDSLVPHKGIASIQKLLGGDSYLFQHASHAPFISHCDEFCDVVDGWIQEQLHTQN